MALNITMASFLPWLKLALWVFVLGGLLLGGGYYFFVYKRRRRWKVEVHEPRTDGKLHSIAFDQLVEIKRKFGTVTYYWMKKAKCEAIPPPADVVDRIKGKDEVDYIRIDREFVPAEKKCKVNYTDAKVVEKIIPVYDRILKSIKSIKTTYFNSEPVRERYMYIPINRTLTAKVEYTPIPYDMNMMAVNEITNADQQFQSSYEFWKKYGAIIVFGVTVVFLLIMAVLTYDYMAKMFEAGASRFDSVADKLISRIGDVAKPPG